MQTFTGYEYLLIDLANQFGLDKKLFEDRINWANSVLDTLEDLADQADNKPLYLKAVLAIRKAQHGIPTGHMVGFDACCSGIQIMSTITGCESGARATGLIDPHVRADAYTAVQKQMNIILHGRGIVVDVARNRVKNAVKA